MDHPGSEEDSCLGWASRQMLGLQQKGAPSHPGAPLAGEGRQGETPGLQMASLSCLSTTWSQDSMAWECSRLMLGHYSPQQGF